MIPFTYLISINIMIYRKLRNTKRSRIRSRSASLRKEGNLASLLLVIGEKVLKEMLNIVDEKCMLEFNLFNTGFQSNTIMQGNFIYEIKENNL